MKKLALCAVFALFFVSAPDSRAEETADESALAGIWEDTPATFGGKRVRVRFEKPEAWSGYIAFPDSVTGETDKLPEKQLDSVEVTFPEVRFVLDATPASMIFEGKLEGDRLTGNIMLEGMGAVGSFDFARQ